MAMTVDDAGHDDHTAHFDDDRPAIGRDGGEVGVDRLDPAASDQNIALIEIANCRVDTDNSRTLEQDPGIGARCPQPVEQLGPCF
jgi:hypothetical protein